MIDTASSGGDDDDDEGRLRGKGFPVYCSWSFEGNEYVQVVPKYMPCKTELIISTDKTLIKSNSNTPVFIHRHRFRPSS